MTHKIFSIEELIILVDLDLLSPRSAEQIIQYLEELKVTRKALEIACKDNGWSNCDYYLEKAREQ